MGFFDYVSDLYSSLSIQSLEAETADDHKDQDDHKFASGDFNSSKDQQGGVGSAQHSRGATTRGGVSTAVPHSGTDEESDEEKEANKDQVRKPATSDEKGHTPGDGGEGSGQVGADKAGPHGGPVTAAQDDDDDDEGGDDEEEEEEDEPEDIQPKLEEDCKNSKECAPAKHHYDHCVERVTSQQEEHGKAHEDCVEEFFHLAHCATQCAAPKLFKQLR